MAIKELQIKKFSKGIYEDKLDYLAIEEPLEISISYFENDQKITQSISVTMRTLGNDKELALGFLFTENIINHYSQIENVLELKNNKIKIVLKKEENISIQNLDRNFYTTSSCGVCGKSSIDAIKVVSDQEKKLNSSMDIKESLILSLKEKINQYQSNFEKTGGIHASALFDLDGNLISIYEDVGRHNALDKLIGSHFISGNANLEDKILLLSGRASFELIQKAVRANIRVVCAIGAPSSLAVELAKEYNIKLIGFLKENSFNLYS